LQRNDKYQTDGACVESFFCFCLKGVKDLNSNAKAGLLGK
jgi:hypothetical protein